MRDLIEQIEIEESRRSILLNRDNVELQRNKLKYSHPYDRLFLEYFWNELLKIIINEKYSKLVFVGGGAGNEAAYIRSKLPFDTTVILTDLVVDWLKEYKQVFSNYCALMPDGVLSCSFNDLPFSNQSNDYCAVAFLCLHHGDSIERAVEKIMDVFDSAIIFEPVTNCILGLLSRLGISQRKEDVDYSPARLHLDSVCQWEERFDVAQKVYLQFPRDYLPFISHEQQRTFRKEGIKSSERFISKTYFVFQKHLGIVCNVMKLGNLALLHLKKR